eukprot:314111-Amphidinium_carterae.1
MCQTLIQTNAWQSLAFLGTGPDGNASHEIGACHEQSLRVLTGCKTSSGNCILAARRPIKTQKKNQTQAFERRGQHAKT